MASGLPWHTFEARPPGPALVVLGDGLGHASLTLDTDVFDDPARVAALVAGRSLVRVDGERRPDLESRLVPAHSRWPVVLLLDSDGSFTAPPSGTRGLEHLFRGASPSPAPPSPSVGTLLDKHARIGVPTLGRAPQAPLFALLLDHPDPRARPTALAMLMAMAKSGIRDQLDGGFHRAASDEAWVVPCFEKRAIDQAALLPLYLADPSLYPIARGIVGYLERRLLVGDQVLLGEAADLGPYDDASHYTWTTSELAAVLDGDLRHLAERTYDIYPRGELRSDPTRNVLFVAAEPAMVAHELGGDIGDLAAMLDEARQRMLIARDRRPRPPLDGPAPAAVVAQLSLALRAAAVPLGRPDLAERAQQLAAQLAAQPDTPGWLVDHASIGLALVAAGLHDAASQRVQRILADHDDGALGFRDLPEPLLHQLHHPVADRVLPSANALVGQLLVALNTPTSLRRAQDLARDLAPRAAQAGVHGAGLLHLQLLTGTIPDL